MNGRRVDQGHNLVPLPQFHVLLGLIGEQGFEGKAAIKVDAHHRPFPIEGLNVPEQVVADAALRQVGALFLQHHVLGADADIHVPIEPAAAAGRRESDKLLWTDLNGCQTAGHLHDTAALDGVDAYDARRGEVDRRRKYLLYRAALAHSSCFEDHHMIAERERLDGIVRHEYRRHSQLDEPTAKLPPQMLSRRGIERGKRFVEQEQTRLTDQRARQRNALLLPSRQLPRVTILETGRPEQRHDLLDALPPIRRRCGGRKMPRAALHQISSPKRMVPRSGFSSPARHRSVVDFPEPDGPKRTVSEKGLAGWRSSTWITVPPGKCIS